MYTENKSIDWLTAITPTIDDLVVTMDQAEVWVAKSSTLLSVYNLFKTTYDTVYAKYLGDADFYKYSIVTSVASWNLTVTLKNYEGNDPTASKPVKIQIGGVIRTITSACYINAFIAWTNWWNAWSAELATKEIDWFVYILDYNNSGAVFNLWISRYPLYNNLSEATWWYTSEKYLIQSWNIWIENVVNIGRFNATLSAGAGYTWSIPATSVIINSPCYETRYPITSNWTPTLTWTGTTAPTGGTNLTYNYQIIWSKCYIRGSWYNMTAGLNNTRLVVSLPFWAIGTADNIALIPAQVWANNIPNTCYWDINYNDTKLSITFTTANVEYFNFQWYYNI